MPCGVLEASAPVDFGSPSACFDDLMSFVPAWLTAISCVSAGSGRMVAQGTPLGTLASERFAQVYAISALAGRFQGEWTVTLRDSS